MNPIPSERIIGLVNRVYILSIDLISFIKTLEKECMGNELTKLLRELIGKFSLQISDSEEQEEPDKIIAGIEKSNTFANQILVNLQQIKCTKLLLNEKTDLTLRMYKIIEESDELISILKQEITKKNE
jgi:hypothetical protein